jgi:hypothetical protein
MNGRVIILAEEESMEAFLRAILPVAFPFHSENVDWLLIRHRGKSDLEASIPRKIKAWSEPQVRFLIARDNDGGDCRQLKSRIASLVPAPLAPPFLVRIVCQELESWLLGDAEALATAYPSARRHPSYRKWTNLNPDELSNASDLLHQLTGTRVKVSRATAIARHTDPTRNRSRSFQVFLEGLGNLLSMYS